MRPVNVIVWFLLVPLSLEAADRINHAGRILGDAPLVTNAALFNTVQADDIMSRLQIFPRENAWNEDISRRPLLSNSTAMINTIIADLATNRRTLRPFHEMNFVLVPDSQPLVPISFVEYPDESDPGPYPIPANMPVELWPSQTEGQGLYDWQRDINQWGGDRHSILIEPGTGRLWETWQSLMVVANGRTNWQAANGARFDLNSNALRPAGWTSADAAGLSMLGGLVRYDECERGMVEHAIRLVVRRTRREYIYPATHYASTTPASAVDVPAMGQRLRLKSSFSIPDSWTKQERAVLAALKKYGAIVADNGNFFSISVVPDDRFPANAFSRLSSISITNFEVIQTTGPAQGPRSPGAPVVDAGPDRALAVGESMILRGAVHYTNTAPLTLQWNRYSGPTNVVIANPASTNASVTFHAPGTYTLMLSADNQLHAVAYDAVNFVVSAGVRMQISRLGTNITVQWAGGNPPYRLERTESLSPAQWNPVVTTNGTTMKLPLTAAPAYFRVIAN